METSLSMRRLFFSFLLVGRFVYATQPVHPLEPLSTNELRAAIEILRAESKISTNTLFPIVRLEEPERGQSHLFIPDRIRFQPFRDLRALFYICPLSLATGPLQPNSC